MGLRLPGLAGEGLPAQEALHAPPAGRGAPDCANWPLVGFTSTRRGPAGPARQVRVVAGNGSPPVSPFALGRLHQHEVGTPDRHQGPQRCGSHPSR